MINYGSDEFIDELDGDNFALIAGFCF